MNTRPQSTTQPEFVGLRDLAVRCGVNYRTIHRAVRAGKIHVVKFGSLLKVPRREAERVLEKGFSAEPGGEMGVVTQYVCDGCGAVKGGANRWWTVLETSNRVARPGREVEAVETLLLAPFDAEMASGRWLFCGQKCALQKISEFMGRR